MKLAPGEALTVLMAADPAMPELAARVVMSRGHAQLEWSSNTIAAGKWISPLYYPPEPGLHAARSRDFEGLHGFLADSLPEGWGALLTRRRLAGLNIDWASLDAVDRLALVGRRGRGALQFEPATTPPDDVETVDLDTLAEQSRLILLGEESGLATTLAGLAGASGGARPKIHVGFDPAGGVCVADDEMAPGYEPWIVKFRASADPVDIGPIEQAYAVMARSAGVEMSDTRLLAAARGPGYFATRRFDRPGDGRRIHMASLSGAIEAPHYPPGAVDYDMFLRATRAITRHEADVEQAFRRMVFNVLAGNRDDHTRQHAFLMSGAGDWRLAPAYDLTYSAGPGGEHCMAILEEGRNPTRRHVDRLGKAHGLAERRIDEIVDRVRDAVGQWPQRADEAEVSSASLKDIEQRLHDIDRSFAG